MGGGQTSQMSIPAWEAETGRSLSVQFEASLVYIVRPCFKTNSKNKNTELAIWANCHKVADCLVAGQRELCRFRCTICAVSHRTQNFYKESLKKSSIKIVALNKLSVCKVLKGL